MLQACLNGARRPEEHPRLPVTPDDLASDAARVVAAGADALHVHVKDDEGLDTLHGGRLAAVLEEVRLRAPGVPVSVTTGAWAEPDPAARVAAVRGWTALPEAASVNWHEDGADDLAAVLHARGIAIEAGLWHADVVRVWAASPVRDRCLRVLVELPDGLDHESTVVTAEDLVARVRAVAGEEMPILLHGEGSSAWPALRLAALHGLSTRIGLEDVLVLPDGSPAADNAALVRAARAVLRGG